MRLGNIEGTIIYARRGNRGVFRPEPPPAAWPAHIDVRILPMTLWLPLKPFAETDSRRRVRYGGRRRETQEFGARKKGHIARIFLCFEPNEKGGKARYLPTGAPREMLYPRGGKNDKRCKSEFSPSTPAEYNRRHLNFFLFYYLYVLLS